MRLIKDRQPGNYVPSKWLFSFLFKESIYEKKNRFYSRLEESRLLSGSTAVLRFFLSAYLSTVLIAYVNLKDGSS